MTPDPQPSSVEEAVRCWRRRRLRFNAVLFGVGVISFVGTLVAVDLMPRRSDEDPGDFLGMCCAVPVYAVLANVCYTAGAFVEKNWPIADPVAAQRRRDKLYQRGLIFSCVIMALPLLLTAFACVMARLGRR